VVDEEAGGKEIDSTEVSSDSVKVELIIFHILLDPNASL
jgi:hypothetical protein